MARRGLIKIFILGSSKFELSFLMRKVESSVQILCWQLDKLFFTEANTKASKSVETYLESVLRWQLLIWEDKHGSSHVKLRKT